MWLSDNMLFALTTLWHKNDVFQLLMVTDRAFEFDYTNVIFVEHGVQIDETCLNYLTTVTACHM